MPFQEQDAAGISWPGKSVAKIQAETPANSSLFPKAIKHSSKDHILIAGDSLEGLKHLMPQFEGKVNLIFIDPPYNTGSDRFLYQDSFGTKGDTHSAWLSMMLPRLILARNILSEDGVLFVSIDDKEVHHLSLMLHEVFGERNFVANLLWRRRKTQANLSKLVAPVHEYILCFAKDKKSLRFNKIGYDKAFVEKTFSNPDNDPRGAYQTRPLAQPANSTNHLHTLQMPDGREITAKWSCSQETFQRYLNEDRLFIPRQGKGMPRLKIFLSEQAGAIPNTWLDGIASYEEGSAEIERLFGSNAFFISPKPTALIRYLIRMASDKEAIILDFFAGSGSTAHAVLLMNQEDGGTRQSISIQTEEPLPADSIARQQGYETIAAICSERIKRAIQILEQAGTAFIGLKKYTCRP